MEISKMMHSSVTYQIFGSKSSIDLDICFFVDKIESIAKNNQVLAHLIDALEQEFNKPINGNLAVVSKGVVTNCFKGIEGELNNSLFHTYALHKQYSLQKITRTVERSVELKLLRCARTIVSYFTRTEKRAESKNALRGTFKDKIDFLLSIDLKDFDDFGKNGATVEVYKSMAFQLGQTLALMEGTEVYTKESIASNIPLLSPYVYREDASPSGLQIKLNEFITQALNHLPNMALLREPIK